MKVLAPVDDAEDITPKSSLDTKPTATGITAIVVLTQASYDALGTKDANTLYIISG